VKEKNALIWIGFSTCGSICLLSLGIYPEDESNTLLRNVDQLLQNYTASHRMNIHIKRCDNFKSNSGLHITPSSPLTKKNPSYCSSYQRLHKPYSNTVYSRRGRTANVAAARSTTIQLVASIIRSHSPSPGSDIRNSRARFNIRTRRWQIFTGALSSLCVVMCSLSVNAQRRNLPGGQGSFRSARLRQCHLAPSLPRQ
jgi:hypothetical protein